MRIGITGADGFIGTNLRQRIRMLGAPLSVTACPREAFENAWELSGWVRDCDAIIHCAGLSRHPDGEQLLQTNLALTEALIEAMEDSGSHAHIYLASTTHQARDGAYHESKRRSQARLEADAQRRHESCTTLLMANTFGPYAKPFFNSVVSTFCHEAAHGRTPEHIESQAELELIPIRSLVRGVLDCVRANTPGVTVRTFPAEYHVRLGDLWARLDAWRKLPAGELPELRSAFEADLWNTFQSYCG